ncbi:glycerophosphodiester phosphodiesterase family protein [Chitinophaga alhagiae]|uniref:glycerophosphodiester phosphodiesterase family protein n=1 Tax=Chitinophaga alhagiae TaxID=2203219 RepID=UPI000E5C4F01|nr:glycerophosphodiester phosphodiesterase family protein [Chitinophaga alhagiae]
MLHSAPAGGYVMTVAHRGDWRNAPENSLQAIRNCIEMGVDIVEIDLQLTKDSVIVLMHDSKLDRCSTGKGKINQYTYRELQKFRLRDGLGRPTRHPIPTLEEAMLITKGKILVNLDKAENFLPLVYPVLKKTGTADQVIAGAYLSLAEMQLLAGPVLDSVAFMPKIKAQTPRIPEYLDPYEQARDFSVLQVKFEEDTSSLVPRLQQWRQQYGSWIWINTITPDRCGNRDDELALTSPDAAYGWLIERGINIIQTDRPRELIDYLQSRKLRSNAVHL